MDMSGGIGDGELTRIARALVADMTRNDVVARGTRTCAKSVRRAIRRNTVQRGMAKRRLAKQDGAKLYGAKLYGAR